MRIQHQLLLYCYSLFLIFFVTTTLISPSLGDLGKCNPSDYKALMKFKKSLNNHDELISWVQNTDCCHWGGVSCDSQPNRVAGLFFIGGGNSGQIPSSVGDLPYLLSFVFRNSKNITGSIPQSITNLKHLANIFLDWNKLTGSIPESFGRFTGMDRLHLSRNKLTGPIPKSLGDLNIIQIDLSRNKLVGDASMLFNPNHGLTTYVDLSRKQFEFDLTMVKFPKDLNWLDISHNKVFGGIPDEIKDLDNLYNLKVGYNRLCGKIPTGGNMHRFKSTSFFIISVFAGRH
ncbi:hypothetical protein C5167_035660 [Papaver somniferum]|uniref:Leucine-rich repeat-containing N-terminal plant-type domain-containing protein n=1 Tax=Papaver somniferum TaxID=3469 RepID=A0A4Y7KHI6_PAPSO|nr:hypothetical protein C5167_035660 [Papaver somniferum]